MKKKPPVFTNGDISTKYLTPIITTMAQLRVSQRKTLTWNDRERGFFIYLHPDVFGRDPDAISKDASAVGVHYHSFRAHVSLKDKQAHEYIKK
eukprot:9358017-Ditylum_brightwellii.AAC.1